MRHNNLEVRNLTGSLWKAALTLTLLSVLAVIATPAQAQTFKVIHNFSGGQDGGNPYAGLTFDKAGKSLYGTTYAGGLGYGTAFQLKQKGQSWVFNPLFSFNYSDGANPLARVIFGPDGTLYGTTSAGGTSSVGTVFNLRPQPRACATTICPWTETVLHSFQGGSDGATPYLGDLLFDSGNIFGTTAGDTVYEMTPKSGGGYTEMPIYTFSGPDGLYPHNGVIADKAGNLYGTTYWGGTSNLGVAYELMFPGPQECNLNSFHGGNDGYYVNAGLVFDTAGNLYGATLRGGKNGGGTVFQLTYSDVCTWNLNILYSFSGNTNQDCGPWGTLTLDADGNIYGATACDGATGFGNVFKLTHGSWAYTSLYDFTGGNDGAGPTGQVILDANGTTLYGTTTGGGTQNVGVVWEITLP